MRSLFELEALGMDMSSLPGLSARFKDEKWLRLKKRPSHTSETIITSVDLFAGCGGLVVGMTEACRRLGLDHSIVFANEWDKEALKVFVENLHPTESNDDDIAELFDGKLGLEELTENEKQLLRNNPIMKNPDILTGGPPCQGHSDLNNHSRRDDPRNSLYYRMIRAAKVLNPKAIIIENVSTVIHSKQKVVQNSKKMLEQMGYNVEQIMLWANEFGVPQKRKRHFLLASRVKSIDLAIFDEYRLNQNRTLRWAIEDLNTNLKSDVYNSPANSSATNRERMQWLIENNEWNLPNHLRPKCHQNGHNYPAVYGRMKWDEPSSTITSGFGSNGQGRFTHPSANPGRPLTPHEAARIQTFPDWFSFGDHKRSVMSKTIGNAVPPLLAMHVANVVIQSIIE
jgi:DNA (cytosine-5)-methyltransferase 1